MDGIPKVIDIPFAEKFSNILPWLAAAGIVVLAVVTFLILIDVLLLRKQDIRNQLRQGNRAWALVIATFIFSMFYLAGQALGAPTDKYDADFRKANKLYWSTTLDWQWAKGQGMAESGLRRYVCSPVGACGLMQFMPDTAKQFRIDPFDTRAAIYAAAKYMKWLNRNWSAPRPALDRYYLALASYNWGLGSVLRAQRNASRILRFEANLWEDIRTFTPRETKHYAPRIHRWCDRFKRSPCGIR